ncbi:MAG: HDIG domain-containing protein [Candidatus Latescibacterota bacterium]|nr:MAG: HDIG domain-containing protein [Candidatus Latescibacterota bacterium]
MKIRLLRAIRRRKNMSRNGRAERISKHLRLKREVYKGLLPRFGLLAGFVAAAVALFPPTQTMKEVTFKAGEIADRTIIAPFDFEVPLSETELDVRKAGALLKVPPVYVRDQSIERGLTEDLTELFDSLATIAEIDTITEETLVKMVRGQIPDLNENLAKQLLDSSRLSSIGKTALDYQKKVFSRGLIDNAGPLRARAYTTIAVVDGSDERRLSVDNVIEQGDIDRLIREEALRRFGKSRGVAQVFFDIVRIHLRPNLILDTGETQARRDLAIAEVERTIKISESQRIISKHDKVSKEQAKMLSALEEARRAMKGQTSPLILVGLYAGEVLRLLLFGLLFGGYLIVFRPTVYRALSRLGAVMTVFLLYLVFTAAVLRFDLNPYLIPVAFVSLMITALFDYRLGLVTTVFASFLLPLVTNISPNVVFVSLLAGTTAVMGLLRMRSRSHFYSVFILISAASVIGIIGTELGSATQFSVFYTHILWAMANALAVSLSTMFLLPIFENIFNLTTRFTLLELTDLNKPILKRINMEAPGTYHHSMLLGNLVDAVATEIGADALRARVMAYYHDMGKIFKPEYYVENQETGLNPHEKITPQMSSLILLSHVKDGVELAKEEKLPDLVIDAVQQHHGTTVMAFFYQKALETDSHSSVKKDDFRYPGPRPLGREAALLMLADTVEPACRSLQDPTPSSIRNVVIKLVDSRAQEGQLDNSGLTLNDVAKIKEKFISILTGIYHKRVAYPGQEEEKEREGEAVAKPA